MQGFWRGETGKRLTHTDSVTLCQKCFVRVHDFRFHFFHFQEPFRVIVCAEALVVMDVVCLLLAFGKNFNVCAVN